MQPEMLRLADVVRDLRSELYDAMQSSEDEPLQFELGDIELELSVGVSREAGVGGKVRFWVIELGGERKSGGSTTQRLTLKLSPRLIATGRPPTISGDAFPSEGTGPRSPSGG